MKVIVIGSGGMLGHMVYLQLKAAGFDVAGYSKSAAPTVDCVMDPARIHSVTGDVIINCAGVLNKACDEDGEFALQTNGVLPSRLAKHCDFLVQISTDCVYDGKKDWHELKDKPNATSLYGRTKALGEIADNTNVVTLRQSIIGPSLKKKDTGLLHWLMTQKEPEIAGYRTHSWNGITTLELSKLIIRIIQARQNGRRIFGLYHYVTDDPISKHDLLVAIRDEWKLDYIVRPVDPEPMLRCLWPDHRIKPPPPIREQLAELHNWMSFKERLYRHYSGKK